MNEKTKGIFFIAACIVAFCFAGCRTTPSQPADTQSVSREGYIAVGRIDQLNREAQRIQQQFGTELESISGTAADLRTTIYQLIDFSQRLLNEYESLQRQIAELTKNKPDSMDSSDSVDGSKGSPSNSRLR